MNPSAPRLQRLARRPSGSAGELGGKACRGRTRPLAALAVRRRPRRLPGRARTLQDGALATRLGTARGMDVRGRPLRPTQHRDASAHHALQPVARPRALRLRGGGTPAGGDRRRGRRADGAERYFAPAERKDIARAPPGERGRWFFEYWTPKEAYARARGLGLQLPFDCFELRRETTGSWRVVALAPTGPFGHEDFWLYPSSTATYRAAPTLDNADFKP